MIKLKIVTPEGRYLEEPVSAIHAKSVIGEFTLLSNHMPILMSLVPCKLTLTLENGQKEDYAISGGVLHYDDNQAALLTDAIEGKAEIDIPRAQAAYKRARERMEKCDSTAQMQRAELAMKRAINRLSVTGNQPQ
ncbi:ATP synthase F1 subunit epsilon [Erysipelotrichaceae bacterium RD49]|nr:ATP synthase F1 subunit epsilon [Erysipelotrichaceae bacterium RD49]